MLDPLLLFYFHVLTWGYHVEPAYVKAVWAIEAPHQTWGRIGKSPYFAPGGVKECFLKDKTTEEVMFKSIRALRNTAGNEAKMIARLKTYNKTWWRDNYIPDLMATYRQFKRQR